MFRGQYISGSRPACLQSQLNGCSRLHWSLHRAAEGAYSSRPWALQSLSAQHTGKKKSHTANFGSADPGFANGGGGKVEHRKREDRGAQECEVSGGRVPSPLRRGLGGGNAPSPEHFYLILDLKMSTSSAFWAQLLQFSYLLCTQKHCFWAKKTCCCMHTDSKRRQNKPFGSYKGD